MKRTYHIPVRVRAAEGAPAAEVARLEPVILAAIRRAIENLTTGAAEIESGDFSGWEFSFEPFTTTRYHPDRETYELPSYQQGGQPEEVRVEEIAFEEEEATVQPSLAWEHPGGEVTEDRVISGPSPFEGQLIAILPRWETVNVRSRRFALSSDLARAIWWGKLLFGAGSYVILEGPLGASEARYYVLGTDRGLHAGPAEPGAGVRIAGGIELWGVNIRHWEVEHKDDQQRSYLLRALFAIEGNEIFPSVRLAGEFYAELGRRPSGRTDIVPEEARALVFGEIDLLIEAGEIQEAADRLAELDAKAFMLVNWETKARYLRILIRGWTREPQENAILEVVKSAGIRTELDAMLGLVRQEGLYDQLFNDIDKFDRVWTLLVMVGARFGEPGTISLPALVELLQDAGLVPRDLRDLARRVVPGPLGPMINLDALAEIEEAARGFVRFLGGTLEGVWMLLTEPQKIIEGIGQLVKLSVMVHLALLGNQQATDYVLNVLSHMAQQVNDGLKGAHILRIGENLIRRIRWALIWEIASWFIGVGEVKAILSGAGLTEKIAALTKVLRLLGWLGRGAEAQRAISKLEHLARLLSRVGRIQEEEKILRLLEHLPDQDIVRLGRAIENVDVHAAQTFANLAAHPELTQAAHHALGRLEALAALEQRAGRLTENLVEGFQNLARRSGFSNQELLEIMEAIPGEHAEIFMRVVRAMPDAALGAGVGRRSPGFFRGLAERPRSMRFLLDSGYDQFSALYRVSEYDYVRMEQNLDALTDMARRVPGGQPEVEYQRFLDRLRAGDEGAVRELDEARRRVRGIAAVLEESLVDRGFRSEAVEALQRMGQNVSRGSELYQKLMRAGEDVREFINGFYSRPGFDHVVLNWAGGGRPQEGARFIMRYCNSELRGMPVRFEWPVGIRELEEGGETWARYVDVVVQGNLRVSPGGTVFVELKSWTQATLASMPGRVRFQLTRDTALFDPRNIRWVFDSRKVSRNEALEALEHIIRSDPYLNLKWGGNPAEIRSMLERVVQVF